MIWLRVGPNGQRVRVTRQLGSGSYGTVVEITGGGNDGGGGDSLNKSVAVLKLSLLANTSLRESMMIESIMLRRFERTALCDVVACAREFRFQRLNADDVIGLVTIGVEDAKVNRELGIVDFGSATADARTLERLMSSTGGGRRPFDPSLISSPAALFDELADAVGRMHTRAHIVHADIKPANVLLVKRINAANAEPRLIDFGLSRIGQSAFAGVTGEVDYRDALKDELDTLRRLRSSAYAGGAFRMYDYIGSVHMGDLTTASVKLAGTIVYTPPFSDAETPVNAADTARDVYALAAIRSELEAGASVSSKSRTFGVNVNSTVIVRLMALTAAFYVDVYGRADIPRPSVSAALDGTFRLVSKSVAIQKARFVRNRQDRQRSPTPGRSELEATESLGDDDDDIEHSSSSKRQRRPMPSVADTLSAIRTMYDAYPDIEQYTMMYLRLFAAPRARALAEHADGRLSESGLADRLIIVGAIERALGATRVAAHVDRTTVTPFGRPTVIVTAIDVAWPPYNTVAELLAAFEAADAAVAARALATPPVTPIRPNVPTSPMTPQQPSAPMPQ